MEQWGQASLGDTGGKEAAEILAVPILLILLGDLANYFFAKKKRQLIFEIQYQYSKYLP